MKKSMFFGMFLVVLLAALASVAVADTPANW